MSRIFPVVLALTAVALSACSMMDDGMAKPAKPAQADQNPAHQMHYSH